MILTDLTDLQENTIYCMLWKRSSGKIKELYFFRVLEKRTDAIYHPAKYSINCLYSMKMSRVQHDFIDYPLSVSRYDTSTKSAWCLNDNGICFELTDSEIESHLIMEVL
jgi:hypothetical protein